MGNHLFFAHQISTNHKILPPVIKHGNGKWIIYEWFSYWKTIHRGYVAMINDTRGWYTIHHQFLPLHYYLVGGFKHFILSHIFGGVFPTDSYFSGGFKPPTRFFSGDALRIRPSKRRSFFQRPCVMGWGKSFRAWFNIDVHIVRLRMRNT